MRYNGQNEPLQLDLEVCAMDVKLNVLRRAFYATFGIGKCTLQKRIEAESLESARLRAMEIASKRNWRFVGIKEYRKE